MTVNFPFMPNYNALIAEFQAELDGFLKQRVLLDRQIASITKAMDAIKVLAEETNEQPTLEPPPMLMDSEIGFTDRVRGILKANPAKALSAVLLRDIFHRDSPDDDPKIILIHTHNTLKRLLKQDEVEEIITSDGRAYRWKFKAVNALAERMRTIREIGNDEAEEAFRQAFARKPK